MSQRRLALFFVCAVAQFGCATEPAVPAVVPTWHTDVKPISDAYCAQCHAKGGVAPFELSTPAQFKAMKASVISDLKNRVMPPWSADSHKRKYQYDESLTDAQIKTVVDWLEGGAPEGDATKPGKAITVQRSALSRKDFTFKLPLAYKPTASPDDYRCFQLAWPHTTNKYVTGFGVDPGNRKIAHHAVLFAIAQADAAKIDKLDQDDPGEGYTCYGSPAVGEENKDVNTKFLGAWAPGMTGVDFPADTGLLIQPGTKLVLQMHYNVAADTAGTDQTEVHLALADKVGKQAWFMPWFNLQWFFDPATMKIKAGDAKARYEFSEVPADALVSQATLPNIDLKDGLTIHSVFPHMHTRGKTMQFSRVLPTGKEELMVDVFRYDFDWQRIYFFDQPTRVHKGDKLKVVCNWDNSAAGQPIVDGKPLAPKDLVWGEGTYDEMCIAFFYLTLQ